MSPKKHPGKSPRRRQARRKQAFPGWVMWLLGTLSGLAIATFLIVGGVLNDQRGAAAPITDLAQDAQDEQKPAAGPKTGELEFDFYDTLAGDKAGSSSPTGAASGVPITRPTLIQVGSFRHRPDAEALKARLAFLGLVAYVRRAAVHGEQWHRVLLGPYPSGREADKIRRRLLEHGFNAQLRRPPQNPVPPAG